jgi:PAS domain S-box-containing protein
MAIRLRSAPTNKGTSRVNHEHAGDTASVADPLRQLFDVLDEGYCLCEIILDDEGCPVDYRFLEANPLFETMTGLANAVGRTAHELLPDLERHWVDTYARVALGSEPIRFQNGSEVMGRWFDVFAAPVAPRGRFALVFRDVTARRREEAEMRQAQAETEAFRQQLTHVLERMTDGFVIMDADFRLTYMNEVAARLGNRPADALLGRLHWDAFPSSAGSGLELAYRDAMAGQYPVRLVNHYTDPSAGVDYFAEVDAFPSPEGLSVFFRDVTGARDAAHLEREARRSLQESREQLARIFELSPAFLAVMQGPDHVIELVNPAYRQLVSHRDVVGRPARDALPEIEAQGFLELLDRVYQTGEPFVGNEVAIQLQATAGGPLEDRFLNFVYQPLRGPDGAVSGILSTGIDITPLVHARMEIERALEETRSVAAERDAERRQLLTVLEQAPLAIAITGPSGEIRFRNSAFDRLWGRPAHETRAETYSDVYAGFHLDGRPIESREWPGARAVLEGEVVEGEVIEIVQASGRRITVWINSAPVRDTAGKIAGAVVMFRDVTDERATEQQLRDAQRIQAVGTLAGGVAHEINNQMTAVLGFGEFVLNALGPDHAQAEDIRVVLTSARRAARISQQLLAFTRQQVTRRTVVALPVLIERLTPVLVQLLGTDKVFATPRAEPMPPIVADADQVDQVLINLVANARDATETGGRVTIAVDEVLVESPLDAAPGEPVAPGRYVRLTVTDTGHGMSAATLQRIFDPFFTTKEVGKGTGLGLSMVYGTLRRHGGYVRARSEPAVGTTMELYWPAAPDALGGPGADAARGRTPAGSPVQGGATVLVVEDDSRVRALAVRALQAEGYVVLEAADGVGALALLDESGVRPQLVVTDVVMPRMNGRQLHDAVVARWPGLPVLFMSGHTGEAAVLERLVPAGAAFLGKPFTPGALARAVAELLPAAPRTR